MIQASPLPTAYCSAIEAGVLLDSIKIHRHKSLQQVSCQCKYAAPETALHKRIGGSLIFLPLLPFSGIS